MNVEWQNATKQKAAQQNLRNLKKSNQNQNKWTKCGEKGTYLPCPWWPDYCPSSTQCPVDTFLALKWDEVLHYLLPQYWCPTGGEENSEEVRQAQTASGSQADKHTLQGIYNVNVECYEDSDHVVLVHQLLQGINCRAAQENRNSSASRLLLLTEISSSREKKGRLHFTLPSELHNHSASTITQSRCSKEPQSSLAFPPGKRQAIVLWRSGNVNPLLMLSLEDYLTVTLPLSRSSNLEKLSQRNNKNLIILQQKMEC